MPWQKRPSITDVRWEKFMMFVKNYAARVDIDIKSVLITTYI